MNNRFVALFCITLLALAPACCKRDKKAERGRSMEVKRAREVNTLIDLDNAVVEIEDPEEIVIRKKSLAKF